MNLAEMDKIGNQVLEQIIPNQENEKDSKMSLVEYYDQPLTSVRLLESLIEFK